MATSTDQYLENVGPSPEMAASLNSGRSDHSKIGETTGRYRLAVIMDNTSLMSGLRCKAKIGLNQSGISCQTRYRLAHLLRVDRTYQRFVLL